jgi:methylenetetrahydrofolate dehydrogenase (NADP+)/methenyltetrahydrofolate cyclohydrolase
LAKLLEGKVVAERIKEGLKEEISGLSRKPVLASVMAGNNPGVEAYVRSQQKTAAALGVEYLFHKLDKDITEAKLIEFIQVLNADKSVNGVIIQLPLPAHIDYKKICRFVDPEKDVEGMHPANMGRLVCGKAKVLPCTAAAVMELLKFIDVDLYGREVVVVGHSGIVGKPLALLLLEKLSTVTVCHIGTNVAGMLEQHIRAADILVVAVGKARLIKGELIKEGAIVIDVGINRVDGKIVGDVEFETAEKRAAYITPVPGGVGPLTVTMLMRNLVEIIKAKR